MSFAGVRAARAAKAGVGVALVGMLAAVVPGAARAQARPTCPQVISEVDRVVDEQRGRPAGALTVSRRLDTDLIWVLRCMRAYGRVPAKDLRVEEQDMDELDTDLDALDAMTEEGGAEEVVQDELSSEDMIEKYRRADEPKVKIKSRRLKVKPRDEEDDPFLREFGPLRELR